MKIGYIWQRTDTDLAQINGPVLHVRAVVDGLRQRGHIVRLLTYHDGRPAYCDQWEAWHPLSPRYTSQPWFRGPERAIRGVQARLRLPYAHLFDSARFADAILPALNGYDVLYERYDLLATGATMAAKRLNLPLVVEMNGNVVEEYAALGIELSAAQWALADRITGSALRYASRIITVSEPLRRQIIQRYGLPEDRLVTITNGADTAAFTAGNHPGAAEPAGAENAALPIIIFVGAFQPWHGLDLILRAFGRLRGDLPARLMLVGEGPIRPALETQASALGVGDRVTFTGAVPHTEVPALLARAALGVVAHGDTTMGVSIMPLKLVEYMAAGLAVVAPDTANLRGLLRDGQTALLFRPGDEADLARTIERLLEDPDLRLRLGASARAQALERHSWQQTVAAVETLLDATVTGQPAA